MECQSIPLNVTNMRWALLSNLVSIDHLVNRPPLSLMFSWFAVRDGYKNNFAKRPLPLVWANFRGNFDGAKKGINLMVCSPLVCINALEGA